MQLILKSKDIIDELSCRTGFFKKDIKIIVEALGDIIVENMDEATLDERSEIHLTTGCVVGAYRVPEREVRDPRNQNVIISPSKIIPYSKFMPSFRKRINQK